MTRVKAESECIDFEIRSSAQIGSVQQDINLYLLSRGKFMQILINIA